MDERYQTGAQGGAARAVRHGLGQRRWQPLQGHALRRLQELGRGQGKLPRGAVELHRGKIDPDFLVSELLRPRPEEGAPNRVRPSRRMAARSGACCHASRRDLRSAVPLRSMRLCCRETAAQSRKCGITSAANSSMFRLVSSSLNTPNCSIVTKLFAPVASRKRASSSRTVRGLPTTTVPLSINSSSEWRLCAPSDLRKRMVFFIDAREV